VSAAGRAGKSMPSKFYFSLKVKGIKFFAVLWQEAGGRRRAEG
jgi:hypothetical protein